MTMAAAQLETYVAEVVDAIEGIAPVARAFVVGSALVGGFDPATSDLDVVVVVERTLKQEEREAVVA
jgi:predicted nucleotidyltransferase